MKQKKVPGLYDIQNDYLESLKNYHYHVLNLVHAVDLALSMDNGLRAAIATSLRERLDAVRKAGGL